MIQRVLEFRNVEQALDEENRRKRIRRESSDLTEFLPSVITCLSPENRATIEVERLQLRLLLPPVPGNPATELRILVNGRPAEDVWESRVPIDTAGKERRSISVGLAAREYPVKVLAKNDAGFGNPARVQVVYEQKIRPRQTLNVPAMKNSDHPIRALSLKQGLRMWGILLQ